MENVKEFKYMKKTEDAVEGYIYAPWITNTTGTFINNIQVWDCRWWVNIFCKINWFFHLRLRKQHKKYANKKINTTFYGIIKTMEK